MLFPCRPISAGTDSTLPGLNYPYSKSSFSRSVCRRKETHGRCFLSWLGLRVTPQLGVRTSQLKNPTAPRR